MYLQGFNQVEIAEALDVSQATISSDIKSAREEWRTARTKKVDRMMNRELARIDHLARIYWDAWERSIGEVVTVTEKVGTNGVERSEKTEQKVGDRGFLDGVAKCIDMRTKLLGVNKERPPEAGDNHTVIIYGPGSKPQHVSDERRMIDVENGKVLPPGTSLSDVS